MFSTVPGNAWSGMDKVEEAAAALTVPRGASMGWGLLELRRN